MFENLKSEDEHDESDEADEEVCEELKEEKPRRHASEGEFGFIKTIGKTLFESEQEEGPKRDKISPYT